MGVTSMGMDDEQNGITKTSSLSMMNLSMTTREPLTWKRLYDISIAGSISITGDTDRECRGESGWV